MTEKEDKLGKEGVKIMTTKVQKWGNSLAIRIPKNIADQIDIDQGTEIELYVEDDGLIIKPKRKTLSLNDLLNKVTDENRHKEIVFGVEGNESL